MATGQLLGFFSASSFYASNATAPAWTHRNNVPVLAYDATTDEYADALGVWGPNYGGGGAHFDIDFLTNDINTAHLARWEVYIEARATNGSDLDSDQFSGSGSAGAVANATAGKVCTARVSISHANLGSPSPGDMYRIRLRRDADGSTGTDDIDQDCHFQGVYITEQ